MKNARTWEAPVGAFYGESISTLTSVKAVTIPVGTKSILINVTGDFRMQLAPGLEWLAKTVNNEVTFTDYTSEATDKTTSTVVTLSSLSTAVNGDYFYAACEYPFGGLYVDVNDTNSSGSGTLTGYTWQGSWTLTSVTDNTNASQTMGQDGVMTWTPPTGWKPMFLKDLFPNADAVSMENFPVGSLYVIRFQTSAALDSTTTLYEVVPVTCETAGTHNPYGWFQADTDVTYPLDRSRVGSLAVYDATGSKTALVTYCFYALGDKS